MKAALYLRVSTEDQAREGYSIDAQKRNLTKYAIDNNLEIYDYYIDDGWSAKDLNRPRLQDMLKDVKAKKINAVCVWALDRLTRDVVDMWTLINTFGRYNVKFLSMSDTTATDTASGRLELNVKGIFSQYERERIGERVVEGMLERAKKGYYTANRVLGYDYDQTTKEFTINPEEAKIVRLVFELYCKGWGSFKIAKHLNQKGHRTKAGNSFANNSVRNMIKNGWYYCGKFLYRPKNKTPILLNAINIKEPILTEEEFMIAQKITNANQKSARKYGSEAFTFKKRLKCVCGRTMATYSTWSLRKKEKGGSVLMRYYSCRRAAEERCEYNKVVRNDNLEKEFGEFLRKFADEEYIVLIERNNEIIKELKEKLESAENNLDKELARKKRLQYLLLDENINKEEFEGLNAEINQKVNNIYEEINQIKNEIERLESLNAIEKEKELALALADIWEELSQSEKRELVQRFIKRIVYSDHIEKVEFIL